MMTLTDVQVLLILLLSMVVTGFLVLDRVDWSRFGDDTDVTQNQSMDDWHIRGGIE